VRKISGCSLNKKTQFHRTICSLPVPERRRPPSPTASVPGNITSMKDWGRGSAFWGRFYNNITKSNLGQPQKQPARVGISSMRDWEGRWAACLSGENRFERKIMKRFSGRRDDLESDPWKGGTVPSGPLPLQAAAVPGAGSLYM